MLRPDGPLISPNDLNIPQILPDGPAMCWHPRAPRGVEGPRANIGIQSQRNSHQVTPKTATKPNPTGPLRVQGIRFPNQDYYDRHVVFDTSYRWKGRLSASGSRRWPARSVTSSVSADQVR